MATLPLLWVGCDQRRGPARGPAMALGVDPAELEGLEPEEAPIGQPEEASYVEPVEADEGRFVEDVIVPQIGETVALFARWARLNPDEVLRVFGLRSARDLRAGHPYTVTLERGTWSALRSGRRDHALQRRAAFFREHHRCGARLETVVRGDSPLRLQARTGVPTWLLAEENPGLELMRLHPGDRLQVPRLCAGPAAPNRDPSPLPAARPEKSRPRPDRAPAPDPSATLKVRVMRGESLSVLASCARLRVRDLVEANALEDPSRVQAGQVLRVPLPPERWADFYARRSRRATVRSAVADCRARGLEVRRVRVRPGESLATLLRRTGGERASVQALNPEKDLDALLAGDSLRVAVPLR